MLYVCFALKLKITRTLKCGGGGGGTVNFVPSVSQTVVGKNVMQTKEKKKHRFIYNLIDETIVRENSEKKYLFWEVIINLLS